MQQTALALAPQELATSSDFIAAMGAAVTGVCVVTTDGSAGRAGLTVSSMASVSADPPMLLVCINRRSLMVPRIGRHGSFAVNVLAAGQAGVAETFAGRLTDGGAYDFGVGDWRTGPTGAPLLAEAAATFDCLVVQGVEAGSHMIVIGEVLEATRGSASAPLAYTDREYAASSPLAAE